MKRVFISYSADSEEHRARVLALAHQLRQNGVDAVMDALASQPGAPSAQEIDAADFVLAICTEPYRRAFEDRAAQGGGALEAELLARLARQRPECVVPVLLEDGMPLFVPLALRSVRAVYLPQQLQQLLRQLGATGAPVPSPAPPAPVVAAAAPMAPAAAAPMAAASMEAAAASMEEEAAAPPPMAEQASPERARRITNVSLLDGADFVGRVSELSAIRTKMAAPKQGGTGEPLIVIGAAGIGKTTLVLQHAVRCQDAYDTIWLVHAQTESAIRLDLALLSRELGLLAPGIVDEHAEVLAVRTWLATHDRWLLIFDEAAGADVVRPYVPRPARGRVLVTSRGYDWHEAGRKMLLGALAREASIDLLLRTSGRTDAAGADELAAWLEGHPLMVKLAGALARVRAVAYDVLHQQLVAAAAARPGHRLEAILGMAVAAARQRSPAVLALVELIAYLAPHEIPIRLLREHVEHLAPELAGVARNDTALAGLLDDLVRLGMVTRDDSSLSVHAAVQAAIRATACSGAAVVLLDAAFTWDEERPETWAAAEELLPHVLVAIEDPHAPTSQPRALQRLLARTATCLWKRGEPGAAIEQQRRAITLLDRRVRLGAAAAAGAGPDTDSRIALANALATLGGMLREKGELGEAAAHLERARELLAAREDAIEVVPVLRALARVTAARGDFAGARAQLERALVLDRQRLGVDEDLSIADTLSVLSGVEVDAGQLDRAAELLEDALAMQRRLLATDEHPAVAATLQRAAAICERRGDLPGARERLERALGMLRRVLQTDHHVASIDVMNDLARVLMRLGDHLGAQRLLEQTLDSSARLFGGGANPHGAAASYSLAHALLLDGDRTGARRLLERALSGLQTHGMTPMHPTAAAILELLGKLDAVTDPEAARARFEQALEIRRELSGPASPEVMQTTASLAQVAARLGNVEEAARLLDPILEHVQAEPGHHLRAGAPDALFVTADVLVRLGRAAAARDLLLRALAALRRDGADALTLARGRLVLARAYLQLEDLVEARREAREAHAAIVAVLGRGSPKDGEAALLRAGIALRGDEPASAFALAARALRVFDGKDEPYARDAAGRALEFAGRAALELGRRGTAAGLFQRSLERRDAPEVRGELCELLEALAAAGSPYDLTPAVALLQRLAPSWLAERVLGAAALESAQITTQLEVSLAVAGAAVAAAITATAGPPGDYGFRLELAPIRAEGGAAEVRTLAAQARYAGLGRLALVASTSELPWGTYLLTVRFVDAARTVWRADMTVGNEELGNPFLAGPPVRGERFFGRSRLLEEILRHLEDASIVLLGPRRSGKTSVLYRLAQLCADTWTVVIVDLHGYSGLDERVLLRELAGQIARTAGIDAPDADRPLLALRRALAAAGTRRVLLLLDEMAVLARYPDVALQLRAMSKWDAPVVRVVIAGTSRDLDRLTTTTVRGSSPINEFLNRELDQLTREEALSLLERPVLGRYRYERAALERLLELGAGRPFFLNALAHLTFEVVRQEGARVVTEAHVDAARQEAQSSLARWYRELMGELDDASRAALPALIEAGGTIPIAHAEALRSAGIVVGPRRSMTLDPIFIDWWRREGNR